IIAPRAIQENRADLSSKLQQVLGRPLRLQIDQVLLSPGAGAIEAQRAELRQSSEAATAARAADDAIARMIAVTAGVAPEQVTLDHDHRRVVATASVLPGASLATYRALEQRASAASDGWDVTIVPPLGPMPLIRFAGESDVLDASARSAVLLSVWAAGRWNIPSLVVPGLPRTVGDAPTLTERRALAVGALLRESGFKTVPPVPVPVRAVGSDAPVVEEDAVVVPDAPDVGPEFRLSADTGEPTQ
ncbi:MAG: hypothetical protein ABIO63_00920, partial [Casimicrobiaceae bacterium]